MIGDESYDGSIRIYGFRGCRDIHGVKLKDLEPTIREDVERICIDEPMLRGGHMALSADDGNTAFGFTPIVPRGMAINDMVRLGYEHEDFDGQISDDTEIFQRARYYCENEGWNTEVSEIRLTVPKRFQISVHQVLTDLSLIEDGSHGYKYAFPYKKHNKNGQYFADPMTANCATFPYTILGIDVPGITRGHGSMHRIIPLMKTIESLQVPYRTLVQRKVPKAGFLKIESQNLLDSHDEFPPKPPMKCLTPSILIDEVSYNHIQLSSSSEK